MECIFLKLWRRFKKSNIQDGLKTYQATPNAILIDVREEEAYEVEHLLDSINIPIQRIHQITECVQEKQTPLFVYCQSGARSQRAKKILQEMGYTNVTDIGAFSDYLGES